MIDSLFTIKTLDTNNTFLIRKKKITLHIISTNIKIKIAKYKQAGGVSGPRKDKNKVNLDILQIPDKKLLLWNGWPAKGIKPYSQSGPLHYLFFWDDIKAAYRSSAQAAGISKEFSVSKR